MWGYNNDLPALAQLLSDLVTPCTFNNLSVTRGHNFKLFKSFSSTRVQSSFFTVRVINDLNNLPHHVVYAPSLNNFKYLPGLPRYKITNC